MIFIACRVRSLWSSAWWWGQNIAFIHKKKNIIRCQLELIDSRSKISLCLAAPSQQRTDSRQSWVMSSSRMRVGRPSWFGEQRILKINCLLHTFLFFLRVFTMICVTLTLSLVMVKAITSPDAISSPHIFYYSVAVAAQVKCRTTWVTGWGGLRIESP